MVQEMPFKDISIFSSSGNFVKLSGTVSAIFIKGIMRIISVKLF